MAYPDKGAVGLATRNPGGKLRLGLSAAAGSAALYSAVVLFGVGSASPVALDTGRDRHASVVLISRQADTVFGSVQRLPQASPEPGRHQSRVRRPRHRAGVGSATSPVPSTAELLPPAVTPRGPESVSPSVTGSSPAYVAAPLPSVAVIAVPAPELPLPLPLPELQLQPQPLDLPG
jgi:hypothetical protein